MLSPLLLCVSLLIITDSHGSIFYRQPRVGRYGRIFAILKFRTMVLDADQKGLLITVGADSRITKVGVILRKFKIDELPQLINVLCGDMSLVGPRPEVAKYVDLYPQDIRNIVLSVRPGITDYASIEMIDENNILSKSANPEKSYIEEIMPLKLSYAVKYVKKHNLLIDLQLILRTCIRIVIR